MESTTVYLDPEMKRRLKEAAARAHIREARIIREALATYLSGSETVKLEPVGQTTDGGIADRDEEAPRSAAVVRAPATPPETIRPAALRERL